MSDMRALVLKEVGSVEGLELTTVTYPQPQNEEVVVQLKAAALNHRDLWIVRGLYANIKTPVILGSDGAGVVCKVGTGVSEEFIGKEVIINPGLNWGNNPAVQQRNFRILGMPDNGTQAQFVTVPVKNISEKPGYLPWESAAAIPLAGLTGYRALFTQGKLKAGETVLLTGIGGGVAALMLKMSLASGAKVFVTSGKDSKIEQAKRLGALGGVNYLKMEWPEKMKSLLAGGKIDLVIDSSGGENFSHLTGLVKPGGRIVFFGATAGNPSLLNLRQLFWKQITLQGTTMGTGKDFSEMLRLFDVNKIEPVIDDVFPLEQFSRAYSRMIRSEQFGKIVLRI